MRLRRPPPWQSGSNPELWPQPPSMTPGRRGELWGCGYALRGAERTCLIAQDLQLTEANHGWVNARLAQGLASFGCVFVELIPDEKRTRGPWAKFESMHTQTGGTCLDRSYHWLDRGSGLGILLRGDLWVLDVDSPAQMERVVSTLLAAGIMPPMVRTPSGMAHFYFRLPADFKGLGKVKNHLCHPKDLEKKAGDGFQVRPTNPSCCTGDHAEREAIQPGNLMEAAA